MAGSAVARGYRRLLLCHLLSPASGYRYTLEESIYVESGMGGRGIGSALLSRLIAECEKGPWRQMLAIIGDGHNNAGSLAIHKKVRLYRGGSAAQGSSGR